MFNKNIVGIIHSRDFKYYPDITDFCPNIRYPEYLFGKLSDKKNYVYESVRKLFFIIGLDKKNYGTVKWNPLKDLIRPGDKVVLKPNMVLHFNASGEDLNAVVTHGSVVRAVIDYVLIALKDKGEVVICDAPQMNCDFNKLIKLNGFQSIINFYQEKYRNSDIKISLLDLRKEMAIYRHGVIWKRKPLSGDPLGYKIIDLGQDSEVVGIDSSKLYGADYKRNETIKAHSNGHHKYCVSATVLDSDVFISIPKMKVHRKAGVTLNLKNIVGICGNKNYLVHYRVGAPKHGGDEFSKVSTRTKLDRTIKDLLLSKHWQVGKYPFTLWRYLENILEKIFINNKKVFIAGDWSGNDTVWRMVLDLNKIILYADKNGNMMGAPQRKYFSILDGFIGGEKEGPLGPSSIKSNVILGGFNPVLVDTAGVRIMGLDADKIPLMIHSWNPRGYKLTTLKKDDIKIKSDEISWINILHNKSTIPFKFHPSEGWKGRIEL